MPLRVVPALALAALLSLGALAAAQDGREGSGKGGPNGKDSGRQGSEAECRGVEDRDACRANSGGGSQSGRGRGRSDRLAHIQFTVAGPFHLADYRLDGRPVLDRLVLEAGDGDPSEPRSERKGDAFVLEGDGLRLRLHDNPVGLVEFKGKDATARLSFPDGTTVVAGERGRSFRIHYADGRDGVLLANGASWEGRNATLEGFFTFHMPHGDGPFGQRGGEVRSRLKEAVEARHLGAEVALAASPANASQAVQVMAYDDIHVQVQVANGTAAIRLGADLEQGRTVALHVDPALLGNATADRLQLRYFDDHDDGTRTEVVFLRAGGGLADVLDPTDDGGSPEYWVVEDADGLQVLVSVPHWSVHTVTLAGLAALAQPSVLAGVLAGVAGTVVAAVAMFWPRRRD